METISWLATTPEGEQIGRTAAQIVRLETTSVPFWFAPLEPARWFFELVNILPPKLIGISFGLVSVIFCVSVLFKDRCGKWRSIGSAFACGLNCMLTLCGLYLLMGWLLSMVFWGDRWVVPEDAPFVLANFHSHSQESNGFVSPEQAVLWHYRKGYRIVAITDTNTVRGGLKAKKFVERNKVSVMLIVGEEFRGATHLLLLNIRSDISPKRFDIPSAIRRAQRQGGVVIAAHSWTGKHSYSDLIDWGVNGFEGVNYTTIADKRLIKICRKNKLPVIATLDFRGGNGAPAATVLPKSANTSQKLTKVLMEGRCAVLYAIKRTSNAYDIGQKFLAKIRQLACEGRVTAILGWSVWVILLVFLWNRQNQISNPKPKLEITTRQYMLTFLVIFANFIIVVSFGIWSMAWNLKTGWYPSLGLFLLIWCIFCPLNWWLWQKMK